MPKNATEGKGGKRTYSWRNERFFSVTTIIGGALPKPALIYWSANEVAEYAVREVGGDDEWLPPKKRLDT